MLDRRWLVLPLLALALVACGGRMRGRAARGPDGRAMTRLERQAQQDMRCPSPMHVVTLDVRAYQVDGCGQLREYAWTCAGRRCQFQPMIPAIVRASEDLQCAPEQLTVQADTATHRAFFGCMRGAAYSLLCVDHGCTWSRTMETVAMASVTGTTTPPPLPPPTFDPVLADAVIPPPPGAPSAFAAHAEAPPPTSVPPPPTSAPPPTTTAPADTVVIPPPPP